MRLEVRNFLPYTCPVCRQEMVTELRLNRRNMATRLACSVCFFAQEWRRQTWGQTFRQIVVNAALITFTVAFLWLLTCMVLACAD